MFSISRYNIIVIDKITNTHLQMGKHLLFLVWLSSFVHYGKLGSVLIFFL